ncbi:hypothetical protein [Massilia sp. BSC265]|uniref:hypothetical protein n=1 Tax=Massilia sp. BSC265 TaxID=1549812 RepID=UPI000A7D3D13|nr:hypothetical protein [Massilia sp. BSC265]
MKASFLQGMEACADKLGELTTFVRDQLSTVYTSIATEDKSRFPLPQADAEQKALQQRLAQLIAADRESAGVLTDKG